MSDRYRVLQAHGPRAADEVFELARTRRYNGARAIRDTHADSALNHLQGHIEPGDRTTIGPTDDHPDAVTACLYGPNVFHYITTWIEEIPR